MFQVVTRGHSFGKEEEEEEWTVLPPFSHTPTPAPPTLPSCWGCSQNCHKMKVEK